MSEEADGILAEDEAPLIDVFLRPEPIECKLFWPDGPAQVSACQRCPAKPKTKPARWQGDFDQPVNGWGSPDPTYLLVFDQPSAEDDRTNMLGSGDIGQWLADVLRRAGIDEQECFFTVAARCHGGPPKRHEQEACRPFLLHDIEMLKPKIIIPMGSGALWSVLRKERVTSVRGSLFKSEWGIPVMPTFSPAVLYKDMSKMEFLVNDFAKAKRAIEGQEDEPELGEYMVALSVEEAEMVRDYLLTTDLFTYDLETSSLNPLDPESYILCASFAAAVGEGFTIPLVGQFGRELYSPEEKARIEDILREILTSDAIKNAANGVFDLRWVRHKLGVEVKNYFADAQYTFAMWHEEKPHSLEFQRTVSTNMPYYEEFKHDPEIRALIKEHGYAGIPEKHLWAYAAADADCTHRSLLRNLREIEKESAGAGGAFSIHPEERSNGG